MQQYSCSSAQGDSITTPLCTGSRSAHNPLGTYKSTETVDSACVGYRTTWCRCEESHIQIMVDSPLERTDQIYPWYHISKTSKAGHNHVLMQQTTRFRMQRETLPHKISHPYITFGDDSISTTTISTLARGTKRNEKRGKGKRKKGKYEERETARK